MLSLRRKRCASEIAAFALIILMRSHGNGKAFAQKAPPNEPANLIERKAYLLTLRNRLLDSTCALCSFLAGRFSLQYTAIGKPPRPDLRDLACACSSPPSRFRS